MTDWRAEKFYARDAQREMLEAVRSEPFRRGGTARLLKVKAIDEEIRDGMVTGYVTQEQFLIGLTPKEIETALGLRSGCLDAGCRVFALRRQPGPSQAVYELTTTHPDGLAFTAMSDQRYPPADVNHIHQWRLLIAMPAVKLCELHPGDRYFSR